jgi:two-component system sporulation sensor kinase B
MINENKKYSAVNNSLNKLFHEIKNPLAICNGYLEIMKKKENNKYIEIINSELNRINQIIIDYQNNNTKYENINLSNLFNDIKKILNSLYINKNIYIEINCNNNIEVYANYNQLKQMFINIFKNATEAKDKNILLIKVNVIKLKDKLKIIISDNGKGMSKEELERMKEEYYTTKDNGTGLGVPFIFETIKSHNGTISYKSYETKGTTITMKLPILIN